MDTRLMARQAQELADLSVDPDLHNETPENIAFQQRKQAVKFNQAWRYLYGNSHTHDADA